MQLEAQQIHPGELPRRWNNLTKRIPHYRAQQITGLQLAQLDIDIQRLFGVGLPGPTSGNAAVGGAIALLHSISSLFKSWIPNPVRFQEPMRLHLQSQPLVGPVLIRLDQMVSVLTPMLRAFFRRTTTSETTVLPEAFTFCFMVHRGGLRLRFSTLQHLSCCDLFRITLSLLLLVFASQSCPILSAVLCCRHADEHTTRIWDACRW